MRASASKAGLLILCQYWAREDVEVPKERTSKSAQRGTNVHKLLAKFVTDGTEPSFDTDEWEMSRYLSGRQWLKVTGTAHPEMAFAMHDEGTMKLGINVSRDAYPSDAFCGTADLIHHKDGWHLKDWKTGSPSESERWQHRSLAALANEAGTRIRTGKSIYLGDGPPRFSEDYLENTDPAEDAATIRRHLDMIPTSEPSPGYWCKQSYCPARTVCPAHAE